MSNSRGGGCLGLIAVLIIVGSCQAVTRHDVPTQSPAPVQPITRYTRELPVEPTPVQEAPTEAPEEPLPEVDVDVHNDDHNGRDGDLTFGYCRRHWWC